MDNLARGNRLYQLEQEIHDELNRVRKSFWLLGEKFAYLKSTSDWKLSHPHVDYYQYVEGEFGLKRSSIDEFIGIYTYLSPYLAKHPEYLYIDQTKLQRMLPLAKKAEPKQVEELLHKAHTSISVRDFEQQLATLKGKPSQEDCEHKLVRSIDRCEICHKVLSSQLWGDDLGGEDD